jgi:uncharacterized iron-regulated membrane protein
MNSSLYRTIWRWHFFAGLIVLPVLAWMAITGAIYLYKPELERSLFRPLIEVGTRGPSLPIDQLIESVEMQTQGTVDQVRLPGSEHESVRATVAGRDGSRMLAFVRPDSGLVLGTSREGGPLEVVKELHSLSAAGPVANVVVEIVAGWATVLVLTGWSLWWPRGGNRALSLAGKLRERRFWRNFHASVGILAGGVLLFLALTGMPWTAFWGENFHRIVAEQGIGRPAAPILAAQEEGHEGHLPWSMRNQPQPAASAHDRVGAEAAAATALAHGMSRPFILDLPKQPGQPYRATADASRAEDAQIMYIDPGQGTVLQHSRSGDFGWGARLFDWGIYTHQGQQYGEANRLVMLTGCIGVLLLALSAPIMWLKRRRRGKFDAPRVASDERVARRVMIVMIALGVIFPLTGASMLAALCASVLLRRISPGLRSRD